ncbi:tryptophan-rich sensory protein TspO [Mangrovicoccus algicola]|uniref:Tryptophan-rich sensory protein n=1 Tax=Mangrovicoccus algicola TaxID=2771008 RepID=A0A8J6YS58_9RHOB|nr:TspO/MBR family protein [Mangrovicoccus algicola]MBE3636662.1 tryptophan-rich sensory protein [Mangrovicoccus algicola]
MDWTLLAAYLAPAAAAAATGILFKPGNWYAHLAKPRWTPPNWMFPTVWTLLYVLMAVAAARVASLGGAPLALALWSLQITLNAIWSPVFFGLHHMRAGLVIIALLWLAVAATLIGFWQADPLAGALMVPYLAWVSVAAALNRAVIALNPGQSAWRLG